MKKNKRIHDIDSLEKEMYRLQLEAKNIEDKLDKNLDYLQENYFSLAVNSFFRNHKEKEGHGGIFESFFNSESFRAVVSKATDHIVDSAAAGLDKLMDKLFHKKN